MAFTSSTKGRSIPKRTSIGNGRNSKPISKNAKRARKFSRGQGRP